MPQREQTLANHAQLTPAYHFIAAPLGFAYVVWAIARTVRTPNVDTAFALVGALAVFMAIAVSRLQALRVQDRIIRLEERLRLARVLPADLQQHIPSLRPSHLIALRFASDNETPELVRHVVSNPAIKPKEIKQRVKHWQADWFRA